MLLSRGKEKEALLRLAAGRLGQRHAQAISIDSVYVQESSLATCMGRAVSGGIICPGVEVRGSTSVCEAVAVV